jgi:hypothetical protein
VIYIYGEKFKKECNEIISHILDEFNHNICEAITTNDISVKTSLEGKTHSD